jgi:uracil phosphoribosyltransferase
MIHRIDHPLIADRLTQLRDRDCEPGRFRQLVEQVARLMVPIVTADLESLPATVHTPLETAEGRRLRHDLILVPILRAGLGLAEGFLSLLPEARVAHIGLARDETTLEPATYYYNAPVNLPDAEVLVVDPMLATGGSAIETLRKLKEQGAKRLRFVCLVACPEGIERLESKYPEVPVYAAAIDRQLDERGYIRPGLGDAGDRIFGTI